MSILLFRFLTIQSYRLQAADVQAVGQDLFAPERLTEVVWH